MESENFDEDAWKGGAGPIGYLSATIGFLLSVAGCRRLPRRTDLSCAVRRFLLRGSAWLPHLFRRCRRTCLSGGSLPDEVPFGASVLGRRLLLICLIARPDGGGYLKIVLTRADSVRADRGRPSGDGRGDGRAGCPCEGRCRLPRAMTLRANFRAGQRSRRIRLLVLSLCSTTGAEYPNGSYSAAIRPPRRMPCVRHR